MTLSRRGLLGAAAATAILPTGRVRSQTPVIKIGVLTDMSGPYRDVSGPLSLACAQQAADEFAQSGAPFAVKVVAADHQNKADIGASIARHWIDNEEVDMILDAPNSAVALAVQSIVREKNKVFMPSGAATSALTGEHCSPNCLHWAYDTYMLARSTGGATVASGGDTWFFITADYTFGHQLEKDTTTVIQQSGGRVSGSVRYPFPDTTDFSAFLLQAKASGAKVLGLANAGADTVNCVKQAREFGVSQTMRVAGLLMAIPLVRTLGTDVAQGLTLTESFYWDLNERTRALAKRMTGAVADAKPDTAQAGCYASALHYLKAVAGIGVVAAKADGAGTVNRMKAMPFDDDAFGTGKIREDGRVMVNAYLFEVKKPGESSSPWDLYKHIATLPGEQAFRPLTEGHCPFIKA